MKNIINFLLLGIMFMGCSNDTPEVEAPDTFTPEPVIEQDPDIRPNILLIVADDMALSDLGSFGGEIETPNLDALARTGVRLGNFHTGTQCAPTRAMLLSGLDHHQAGVGAMIAAVAPMLGEENIRKMRENPGYEGYLSAHVDTLPAQLQEAGYHTYMTGKWHLGADDDQTPQHRGFERSFVLIPGGAGHLNDLPLWRGYGPTYRSDGVVSQLPDDFYSTQFYTEQMIDYIESNRKDGKPFFGYLAYTAPHWPLQAPGESIEKYKGKYEQGFDQLLIDRLSGLQREGIISEDVEIFPRHPGVPAWDDMSDEEKALSARTMEVYAAMVDDMDAYVGKLMDYLRKIGEYDNTYIFFMSDNGPEGRDMSKNGNMKGWYEECCDNSLDNIGNADSYVWLDQNWGRAHAVPHRMFKAYISEGAVHTSAFATFPGNKRAGDVEQAFISVMDVMPTLLELAGVAVEPGRSLLPLLTENEDTRPTDRGFGMETHGMKAYYKGDHKILHQQDFLSNGDWQLYNLANDLAELNDLSEELPELRSEMIAAQALYEKEMGVVDFETFKK